MDNIFNKPPEPNNKALDQLKYDLNGTNSDSDAMDEDDDSRDVALAIEENIKQEQQQIIQENTNIYQITSEIHIKDENPYLESDIIMPEASQNNATPVKKKEIKTRKEMEEEEREKMQ
ncbi:hypothetical protein BDFB_002342 [Asbolus verrucosus]|uniref:Uncharacterized protein n=1 Tax=Asbolus verrucosus TaxID=1661398 RepID=A0A482VHU4_ASBVE|nr:hypothetical protein BDFB_002342 [Asbolus verrucosus]